jgi:tRNA threonylcarbamoyladenosine biosynthesis protein TsaE
MTAPRIVVRTGAAEETAAVGRAIGRSIPGAFALSLEGPLGSGKTVLAAGVCDALGVDAAVTSPTYTLHHEYTGRGGRRVVHVDCFRLGGPGEYEDLGIADRMEDDTVLLVEWGDRVAAALPEGTVRVELVPEDGDARRIAIHLPDGVELAGIGPAPEEP